MKLVRNIVTKLNEREFQIFTRIANESGLSVEEKLQEIVDLYVLVEKNRFKQTRF